MKRAICDDNADNGYGNANRFASASSSQSLSQHLLDISQWPAHSSRATFKLPISIQVRSVTSDLLIDIIIMCACDVNESDSKALCSVILTKTSRALYNDICSNSQLYVAISGHADA